MTKLTLGKELPDQSSATDRPDEYLQTYEFAEIALGQIKALKQPASPRYYEVWYHYATGYHPAVNQLINQLPKSNGKLTQSDIDAIYERFFSPPNKLAKSIPRRRASSSRSMK